MALTINRPYNEYTINEGTTSIAATPVAASAVVPVSGYVQRVMVSAGATFTGTIAVTVKVNGGSDIANSLLNLPAQTGAVAGVVLELPLVGAGTVSGVWVNEGDQVTFTPSGGTGASITGAFAMVIRTAS